MSVLIVIDRDGAEHSAPAKVGLSLMQIIRNAGVGDLLATCGGSCSCATCHIYVGGGATLPPPGQDEEDLLDCSDHRKSASRLACQVTFAPAMSGLVVTVAPED